MIRRLTRWLLVLQALAAGGFAWAIMLLAHVQSLTLAVALGMVLVAIARLSITANSFRLAWHFRSETPVVFQISWRSAARLFFNEFGASMISSSWNMPFFRVGKYAAAQPVSLPVLLIHGYGCNSGYWHPMSKRLSAASITHHGIDLEPVLAGIDGYVPALAEAIEALAHDSNCDQVILVAHSMGGLAGRAYLRDHGSSRVAAMITLGTPHHGTALARHGIGINSAQMRCEIDGTASAWLQRLQDNETAATRALCVSFYSHHDNIVSPQLSAYLEGATNIALAGIGHVAIGMDIAVQDCVVAQIRQVAAPLQARQSTSTT